MRRKCLDQVDGVLREGARRFAADHQHADDIFAPQQRRYQQRAETGTQDDIIHGRGSTLSQIGDLDRLALRERQFDVRLVQTDMLLREGVNQLLIHAIGRTQMKFALYIVKDVDRSGLGARQLHCLSDDSGEYGFQVEGGVYRLGHFAERAQLLDRAAKLIGALAQCVQKSNVLDCNGCLVGKSLDQSDLTIGEGSDLEVINNDHAQDVIAFEDRHAENCFDRLDGCYPV